MNFTSDNIAPVAPEIMTAMVAANEGAAPSYGGDALSERLNARASEVFERDCRVWPAATGSAANALALACLCPPWGIVYAHRNAHVEEDECSAPEFFTGGAKIGLIDGEHAKIPPEGLARAIRFTARAGVHNPQKGALSITQATENGAVYTPGEVGALARIAREAEIPVHMDGARFANAVARLGCAPADVTWRVGVDMLSLGATKNGAMAAESVITFGPERDWELQLRRKRAGQLFSKMRFIAAQFDAWFTDGLWLRLAGHANAMADRLAAGLGEIESASLLHPVQANAVFARFPRRGHAGLHEAGARYYLWPGDQSMEGPGEEGVACRLVCSWATTPAEVDGFLDRLRQSL